MTEEKDAWALETGLPNDIDGWMRNCRFGTKDEYAQAVIATGPEAEGTAGLMMIADLYDETGELIGSQGWSVGSGWVASDDGKSMHHPTRKNVVVSSRYGQLQQRVIKELGVNMSEFGIPTNASAWEGLGFHWMLEEHETIQGKEPKRGLMPVQFLGKLEGETKAAPAPAKETSTLEKQLTEIAQRSPDAKAFQKEALKIEDVVKDDDLMASVLDDSPTGFYATHRT